MTSHVVITDECFTCFEDFKLRQKYKYILFKLTDDYTTISLDKAVESGTYDDFLKALPPNEPRYAVYDLGNEKPDEGSSNTVFYCWIPGTASVCEKMIYATNKIVLRKRLVGTVVEIQCTDPSEVEFALVLEKAERGNWQPQH